jgi:hypothetical protein
MTWTPSIDADADGADHALALQVVDGTLPALVARPGVFPDVELEQVDRRQAEVFIALHGVFANVLGGEALVEGEPAA